MCPSTGSEYIFNFQIDSLSNYQIINQPTSSPNPFLELFVLNLK